MKTESERRAFVRQYFHVDLTEIDHYDMIINMGKISVDAAVDAVKCAFLVWKKQVK
jgi:cytidylate kinase